MFSVQQRRRRVVQVYVEHDLDDSEVEMHVVDYLVKWFGEKDPERGVTEESVVQQLNEVGFPEELQVRTCHLFLSRNACAELSSAPLVVR